MRGQQASPQLCSPAGYGGALRKLQHQDRNGSHEAGVPGGLQGVPLRRPEGRLLRVVSQPRGRDEGSVFFHAARPLLAADFPSSGTAHTIDMLTVESTAISPIEPTIRTLASRGLRLRAAASKAHAISHYYTFSQRFGARRYGYSPSPRLLPAHSA